MSQLGQLAIAVKYLQEHPEMHKYGSTMLRKLVSDPLIGRNTWQDARHKLGLAPLSRSNFATRQNEFTRKYKAATPALVTGSKSNSTIVHIYAAEKRVKVLYRGVTREYTLKALDVKEAIKIYQHCGYKYTWLNDDVVLLTKRGKRAKQEKAA